jgi:Holliday junction DNA helicase RuvA
MISFLEGKIIYYNDKYIILNTGGIGYKIIMPPKLVNSLSKSQDIVKVFIHSQINIREGTFELYGFSNQSELDLFNLITSINGIGPKSAINILSAIEPKHLKAAVLNEDADYLKKVSGLGTKTAQRLILELKNKIDYLVTESIDGLDLGQEGQAMEALLALGYNQFQAKEALKKSGGKTLEERVREALRILSKNK